jgi:hypothetical protein
MIYQQGDLIIEKIDEIPPSAKQIDPDVRPDGGIELGGGHVMYPKKDE